MADEENEKEYRWETGYEKTWEAIKEDDSGLIETSIAEIIQKAKRKRQELRAGHSKLGMMRHVYLIGNNTWKDVDASDAMLDQDLKPTRQLCTVKLLEGFIDEFFDQNPISQLGIIAMKNKRAQKIADLAGNSKKQQQAVKSYAEMSCQGEPSLQNALELAAKALRLLPSHASREILVVMANLTTCDPCNIIDTIQELKKEKIRCSVIGLAAEVRVCRLLAQETGGIYNVILDDLHYKDQLHQHVDPPAATNALESSLIKMGFPHHSLRDGKSNLAMCMCHLDEPDCKVKGTGYRCPQCGSQYCDLPVECRACGLTLVSAPHLARSYHHLFPVPIFSEVVMEDGSRHCYACQIPLDGASTAYKCGQCNQVFCMECDMYIHDSLRTCPGCATDQNTFRGTH